MELVDKTLRDQVELNVIQLKKILMNLVLILQIKEQDYPDLKMDTQTLRILTRLMDLELILQDSYKTNIS
jgi:hypothetical protein